MSMAYCRRRALIAAGAAWLIGAALPARASDDEAVIAPIYRLVDSLLQVTKAGVATPFAKRALVDSLHGKSVDLSDGSS